MTTPNGPQTRISDADRERAMADLASHYAEGRLDHDEYDERLDAIWTARTRDPCGPMHAPFAFSPATLLRTAILVRCPASRARDTISTDPSATSGTSWANSPRTRSGWVRDTVTTGPRCPRLTEMTRHFRRLPWA